MTPVTLIRANLAENCAPPPLSFDRASAEAELKAAFPISEAMA